MSSKTHSANSLNARWIFVKWQSSFPLLSRWRKIFMKGGKGKKCCKSKEGSWCGRMHSARWVSSAEMAKALCSPVDVPGLSQQEQRWEGSLAGGLCSQTVWLQIWFLRFLAVDLGQTTLLAGLCGGVNEKHVCKVLSGCMEYRKFSINVNSY